MKNIKKISYYGLVVLLTVMLVVCEWYVLQEVETSAEENLIYYLLLYVAAILSSVCAVVAFVSTRKNRTIYLSYPSNNTDFARRLMLMLKRNFRFVVFVSKEQQGAGETLKDFVYANLSSCSKAIFVIDGDMTQEQMFEYKNCKFRNIKIIPILINNTKTPSIVGDLKTYTEQNLREIIRACME